ncbi:hypothetical protein HmCmsJML001_03710 [Escherichia coli]|nr:hypothetical protein HmCmsJML001_03710 [Escherichia coli]
MGHNGSSRFEGCTCYNRAVGPVRMRRKRRNQQTKPS